MSESETTLLERVYKLETELRMSIINEAILLKECANLKNLVVSLKDENECLRRELSQNKEIRKITWLSQC